MKRYYNLKEDKPNVNGCAIVVNTDVPLEERLEEATLNVMSFKFLRQEGDETFYHAWHEPYYVPRGRMQVPALAIDCNGINIGEKSKEPILLVVNKDGDLRVHETPKDKKVYLSEITIGQAEKMREDAGNWYKMQCWV